MSGDATLTFVGAERGNAFMNELLASVAHEVAALGIRTEAVLDEFPEDGRRAYVVVPHEYFACVEPDLHPTKEQLGRTIAFCTEQPGTHWFDLSASHARSAGAAVDIYPGAVRELRRRGVRAEHFRLGYTERWDAWGGDEERERPVDVLHLGAVNERRLRALAGYAETLWPLETRLLVPPEKPKTEERADFLVGERKWELLASSKTILNLHRQQYGYFEWVRVLEAAANGCVVVSEHSAGCEPLVPGEHFVSGTLENLAFLSEGLLGDEERLARMRSETYELVRSELPMRPAAERLAALAEKLARSPRRSRRAGRLPAAGGGRRGWARVQDPRVGDVIWQQGQLLEWSRRSDAVLKKVLLGQMDLARKIAAQEVAAQGEDAPELQVVARTPAYERSRPRVSVLVPLYNHAEEVEAALASVAASELLELEVVVLDDASMDRSRESVLEFLLARPFLPALLLRHPVNRGLGRTRNDLVAAARGELVFMLDADNEIYPTALPRLVDALDRDPGAFFAYPMLEEHENGESDLLRSCLPWEPERLAEQNYIDAMSLLRRDELLALGGYTEDLRLHGWEDYDLWCRCLQRGLRGVLVPQVLARYRRAGHSMLASVTNLDVSEAESLLRARYPVLAELSSDD
jgi:hypothetical protein